MLDTLDILIGFTVVMLIISMAVTMITQALASGAANLRGWCLKQGVSRLLALMDQGITLTDAKQITDHVLRNPLVGRARIPLPKVRKGYSLATVILREELVRLLLDFAIPGDAEKANPTKTANEPTLRDKFRASLKRNGIDDPAEVLRQVRNAVVELEKTNPELSHNARLTVALLNFGASDFLSKFNTWFDQTMDRVSDLFTRQVRAITAFVALALALTLQLDSVGLINRLSVDEDLRNELVQKAINNEEAWKQRIAAQQQRTAPDTADNGATEDGPMIEVRRTIESAGVVSLPRDWKQWSGGWWEAPPKEENFRWPMLFGILLSAALLSLGAPFWYSILANLLKLRSALARKDEVQREERQTTQAPPTGTAPGTGSLPPTLSGGERGDLAATG
jgi:hypothetical protein